MNKTESKKLDKVFRRHRLMDEFELAILVASSQFKPKEDDTKKLKISNKEKLYVFSRIAAKKAASNLNGE